MIWNHGQERKRSKQGEVKGPKNWQNRVRDLKPWSKVQTLNSEKLLLRKDLKQQTEVRIKIQNTQQT